MINRRNLSLVTLLIVLLGVVLIAGLLFGSLSINEKQENDAWATCDLSNLKAGEVVKCGSASIYRRTTIDTESIDEYFSYLADPDSLMSEQPEAAENRWRSENEEYFVFLSFAPKRLCSVKLMLTVSPGLKISEKEALEKLPYFTELCEGRTWDTSGRLYRRTGGLPEFNLIVPQVKWLSPDSIRIYSN